METYTIPKTEVVITCRNKREESAARIFIDGMRDIASWAAASDDPTYWARRVVDECGYLERSITELNGRASVMYYLGMTEEPFTSVEIHDAIVALYNEAAGNTPADDEDTAAAVYMDAVKADAAYCLGIEEGSDEWYALADI